MFPCPIRDISNMDNSRRRSAVTLTRISFLVSRSFRHWRPVWRQARTSHNWYMTRAAWSPRVLPMPFSTEEPFKSSVNAELVIFSCSHESPLVQAKSKIRQGHLQWWKRSTLQLSYVVGYRHCPLQLPRVLLYYDLVLCSGDAGLAALATPGIRRHDDTKSVHFFTWRGEIFDREFLVSPWPCRCTKRELSSSTSVRRQRR